MSDLKSKALDIQKLVDYQLPDNVFLDRCQVLYPSFESEIIDNEE